MPDYPNAMTLAQYAVLSNDPLVAYVANSVHRLGSVLQDIPFITKPTLKFRGVRFTNAGLPEPQFRKINEATTTVRGQAQDFTEQAYILSNNIDVDRLLLLDQNAISDPRMVQLNMFMEAVIFKINDYFINNNPVTGDPDAPTGLRYRLDNPTTYGVNSAMKIDAGGVVMTAALTADSANAFLAFLQQILDELGAPEGDNLVLYSNELLRRRIDMAVRKLGAGAGFNTMEDAFGRRVDRFKNAVIRTIGRKADASTQIITNTETNAGADGASDYTSLYGVRYGEGFCQGWQVEPLNVVDFGQVSGQNFFRLFIEWAFGFVFEHDRSIVRGYDIKVS